MKPACPDLDRETLNVAREALAAGTQRELRPALGALTELILAARQDGYRQGLEDGAAGVERRMAEVLARRPALRLAGRS